MRNLRVRKAGLRPPMLECHSSGASHKVNATPVKWFAGTAGALARNGP